MNLGRYPQHQVDERGMQIASRHEVGGGGEQDRIAGREVMFEIDDPTGQNDSGEVTMDARICLSAIKAH